MRELMSEAPLSYITDACNIAHPVLAPVSKCCPGHKGRLSTRYSPVRHYLYLDSIRKLPLVKTVRLACVKHAASVRPEPGSNSPLNILSSVS